jgi:hypothetical protein
MCGARHRVLVCQEQIKGSAAVDDAPPDRQRAEASRAAVVGPAAVDRGTPGLRRDSSRVGLPSVRFLLTSAELISAGVRPEVLASLALRRASGGGVAKSGGHSFDCGHPTPSYLTGVFEELAQEDPWLSRRVSLTPAGHTRYEQLSATPRRTALRVPHPQFPTPAPGGQPVPGHPHDAGTGGRSCGSVLAPIPDVRYVCALAPGHDTGPDRTFCPDAEGTVRW